MHGLLFHVKSDKEKYGGYEFKLNYKLFFKDPDKEWDDNIAESFFVNDLKIGSPQEVKGDCGSSDSTQYDKFYDNLEKLYDSKRIEEVASLMDARKTHNFEDEGILILCVGEINE